MKNVLNFLIIVFIYALHIEYSKCQKVVIPLLARNKEHTLPYFFYGLDYLNYPKKSIYLWVWTDHNEDNTTGILKEWVNKVQDEYAEIRLFTKDKPINYESEVGPFDWPASRYKNVIEIKEKALKNAIDSDMDYIFYLDMDNFITNPDTLNFLIRTKLPLVSPMLTSGHYSNFWGAMNEEGYYKRHDDYMPIVKREKKGCFKVPMIHSTYLIDLKKVFPGKTNVNIRKDSGDKHVIKNFLTFDPENFPSYNLTLDDIIIFAKSAQASKVDMHICNNETFGHLLEPLKSNAKLDDIKLYMHELKMDILNSEPAGLLASRFVPQPKLPTKNTMGFDKVYMINLEKRPERRERMLNCFDELGLDVTLINGIDGNKLNDSFLKTQNITMLGNYKDPYHKRALTLGEIGCFLSHYQIWREVLARDYRKVLVFEDDIRFEKDFRTKVEALMKEPERLKMNWDLIYFGRKRLVPPEREKYIKDSDILVWPDYSYWTLSYALSHTGAQKLSHCSTSSKPINPLGSVPKDDSLCPLNKMVPVDEYLPIMFDMHPEEDWKKHFPNRDLVAFSAYPLIVYPTHYTGDDLYFSDTEDSPVIANMTAVPHLFNHRYDTNGHKNREEL